MVKLGHRLHYVYISLFDSNHENKLTIIYKYIIELVINEISRCIVIIDYFVTCPGINEYILA